MAALLPRYHRTIKDFFNHRQRRLPTVIKRLIEIVRFRLICTDKKMQEATLKFPVQRYSSLLERLGNLLTKYPWDLVLEELKVPEARFSFPQVDLSIIGYHLISRNVPVCSIATIVYCAGSFCSLGGNGYRNTRGFSLVTSGTFTHLNCLRN